MHKRIYGEGEPLIQRQRDQGKGTSLGKKINDQEFSRNPQNMTQFRYLDFQDCFARSTPVAKDGKIIGPDPVQFKNMPSGKPQTAWEQR